MPVNITKLQTGDVLSQSPTIICTVYLLDGVKAGFLKQSHQLGHSDVICYSPKGKFVGSQVLGLPSGYFWLVPHVWDLKRTTINTFGSITENVVNAMLSNTAGAHCTKCHSFNEYQSGPFLCYSCKSGW